MMINGAILMTSLILLLIMKYAPNNQTKLERVLMSISNIKAVCNLSY